MTSSPLFDTVWDVPRNMRAAIQSSFTLSSDAFDSVSPFTGERSPSDPFVQVFNADITPPAAKSPKHVRAGEVSWRDWQGFMTRMRGTSGKLRIVDYYRMFSSYDERHDLTLSNWSDGTRWSDGKQWKHGALPPFVTFAEAARAGADTVVLRGLPANVKNVLSPADLIEGRPAGIPTSYGNLYEVVHYAGSNADGKVRVYLQPGLRQGFAAGDMMVLRYPTGVFRLSDKNQGIVTRTSPSIGNLGFRLIEHIINV